MTMTRNAAAAVDEAITAVRLDPESDGVEVESAVGRAE
jgi:hypothetical protein